VVTLIGPNGAGKSTTLQALSGVLPTRAGKVIFDGRDITRMKTHKRVSAGSCRCPKAGRCWPG